MATTNVNQEQANEMRRLLAEDGEDAVRQRYGEAALASDEYRAAQQSITARRSSERERYQEAVTAQDEAEGLQNQPAVGEEVESRQEEATEEENLGEHGAETGTAETAAEPEIQATQEQEEEELQRQEDKVEDQSAEDSSEHDAVQNESSEAYRDRGEDNEEAAASQDADGSAPAESGQTADQSNDRDQSSSTFSPAVAARQARLAEARERLRQDREITHDQGLDQSSGMSQ